MVGHPTSNEEAQLAQTIEMFEVITQSQPQDYQSLEILKEAYAKLGRDKDVVGTSKRIANAYVLMGQLSSAILEYESILQRFPNEPEALAALTEIESKANSLNNAAAPAEVAEAPKAKTPGKSKTPASRLNLADVDDGRQSMHKVFVEGKYISSAHFELCWSTPDLSNPNPFRQGQAWLPAARKIRGRPRTRAEIPGRNLPALVRSAVRQAQQVDLSRHSQPL
jgi:tetratricopeptide (TPR) repeat protein